MKTAISTDCFHLKDETENALSLIKEAGAEICSVHLQTFYEYRPEFAKKYAHNLGGAEVCSISTGANNFEPQLFSPSRRIRGDGYYWLEQVMRSARLLGAKRYVLKAPLISGNYGYLNGISQFCATCGLGLCVENSSFGLVDNPYIVGEIKSYCPEVCFSLNLSEAKLSAYPYQMYLMAMAGSLAQVVIGSEPPDLKELVKLLKEVGFDGEIIIETHNFTDISELKSLINKVKSAL